MSFPNNEMFQSRIMSAEEMEKHQRILSNMMFVSGMNDFEQDAAAINEKNGFSTDDPLIDEFQQWFLDSPFESKESFVKFNSIFNVARNARAGLKLMLAVGEIGEALEAVRKNLGKDAHCPEFLCEEVEIADAMIRLINYAHDRKLRLAEAMVAKNEYNRNRKDHSKTARTSEHGKRF